MKDLDGLMRENARMRGLIKVILHCAYTKDCDGCRALDARGWCRLGEMLETAGFKREGDESEREGDESEHGPTVEDVLIDFVIALNERGHLSNGVALTIDEFAPKLRTVDDGED